MCDSGPSGTFVARSAAICSLLSPVKIALPRSWDLWLTRSRLGTLGRAQTCRIQFSRGIVVATWLDDWPQKLNSLRQSPIPHPLIIRWRRMR